MSTVEALTLTCAIKQHGLCSGEIWPGAACDCRCHEPQLTKETEATMGDYEDRVQDDSANRLFDVGDLPDRKQQGINELGTWLDGLRDRELSETLRKAAQYDNVDLVVVGQTMATTLGIEVPDQRTVIQLGVAFYLLGKTARIIGAIAGGRQPQADDWYDARIYGTMGLKTHETGKWA